MSLLRSAAAAGFVLFTLVPAAVAAQTGRPGGAVFPLMPGIRYFENPVADPIEPRFAIGLAYTDLFRSRGPERPAYAQSPGSEPEVQAVAAIGGTIPVLLLYQEAGGGIVIGAMAGVFARFRIEKPSRDDLGQDWAVGMPIEMSFDRMSARFRIIHRSSHLGDEFAESTGATRIEMGGESIDALLAYRFGALRVYGGGGWIFHSNTDNTAVLVQADREDRFTMQAGADARFRPFDGRRLSIVAGADWQSAERTNWRSTYALAGGLRVDAGPRDVQLVARYIGGGSALGQFFLSPESVWSLELLFGI